MRVDLRVQHRGSLQPAFLGQIQKLVVRHGTPEEVAEPRCEFDIGNAMHGCGVSWLGIALDAEKEIR